MGKSRKNERKVHTSSHHDNTKEKNGSNRIVRRSHSQTTSSSRKKSGSSNLVTKTKTKTKAVAVARPRVPFAEFDRVLCVGEGDFSFALSLATTHNVKHIVATCYDDEETLHRKYPHARRNIARLLGLSESVTNEEPPPRLLENEDSIWHGLSPSPSPPPPALDGPSPDISSTPTPPPPPKPPQPQSHSPLAVLPPNPTHRSVHYSINATKLSSTHAKLLRTQQPHSPFTKIVFNFPHVGGLSTDVNRQVRANQELLVGFFRSAVPLLASVERPVRVHLHQDEGKGEARFRDANGSFDDDTDTDMGEDRDDEDAYLTEPASQTKKVTITHGQLLITLFDGLPYSLWNIRDLARHCGLSVIESFAFPWAAYPGYTHARTLGEIVSKSGKDRTGVAGGKRMGRAGAWRGEERGARCFVLEVRDWGEREGGGGGGRGLLGRGTDANSTALGARKGTGKRKRKGGSDSGSD